MSDHHQFLARQCAFNRMAFGPGERRKGVPDHIRQELEEIEKEHTAEGRASEWVDVVLLAQDGLLRALREHFREEFALKGLQKGTFTSGQLGTDYGLSPSLIVVRNGEPTNDFLSGVALRMLHTKRDKNELREWDDWRVVGEDHAVNHKAGSHD